FSSRRRHTRFDCDWSSDVCSSDLFAKFETRFQIIWVIGALFGLIAFAPRVGFLIVSFGAGVAAFLYGIGSLAWRQRTGRQRTREIGRASCRERVEGAVGGGLR